MYFFWFTCFQREKKRKINLKQSGPLIWGWDKDHATREVQNKRPIWKLSDNLLRLRPLFLSLPFFAGNCFLSLSLSLHTFLLGFQSPIAAAAVEILGKASSLPSIEPASVRSILRFPMIHPTSLFRFTQIFRIWTRFNFISIQVN